MRVALVHDYLNQAGGAEKVAEIFCEMFPDAPLYTSVYDPAAMPTFWQRVPVRTTFMQRISPRLTIARQLLPLYPFAFESLDFGQYDLVLSSCSTFSKGIITPPETLHVCYCHNTTRFAWMYREYVTHEALGALKRAVLPALVTPLRAWDYAAAQRVDHYVANSRTTQRRIAKYYRRDAVVIEPPIRVDEFAGGDGRIEPYFLIVSRLQSYKRLDLAVEAANRLGVRLRIVGSGPDGARLRRLAGKNVEFLGRVPDAERVRLLQRCSALIVPGREDFGLVSLEAQAAGRPVIAYAAGGSLETVLSGKTGVLFPEATAESLCAVLRAFDPARFSPEVCRAHARQFDVRVFRDRLHTHLDRLLYDHSQGLQGSLHDDSRRRTQAAVDPSR